MVNKDKTYYKHFDRHMKYLNKIVDYHIKQADSWEDICRITEGKRGYGWLNKFAKRMVNQHVKKGIKIGNKGLTEYIIEITHSTNCLICNNEDVIMETK